MNLDENAAAFGLFHLAYANLFQRLAATVHCVRQLNEPNLRFDEVFGETFSSLCQRLKKELKQFNTDQSPWLVEDVRVLQNTCSKMRVLARWRNQRVHALVSMDEGGIRIYDSRTRKPLNIARVECEKKIREAIKLNVELEHRTRSLVSHVCSKKKMVAMLKEAFRKAEVSSV
jgi:inorganic pyrophosphatase/exopolyphosphatase